jgi:hypothetical protein
MISRRLLAVFALVGTAANAAELPIKPGTYVLAGTPCKDPPFAAMFTYADGQFSYPHASDCRSRIVFHAGYHYRIAETCSALGDGTPTKPTTFTSTYTIESTTRLSIARTTGQMAVHYRRCPAR